MRGFFPLHIIQCHYLNSRFDVVDDEHEWKQCPQYILDQEYNTGCQFKTEGYYLSIFIKDTAGKGQNYTDEQGVKGFSK